MTIGYSYSMFVRDITLIARITVFVGPPVISLSLTESATRWMESAAGVHYMPNRALVCCTSRSSGALPLTGWVAVVCSK